MSTFVFAVILAATPAQQSATELGSPDESTFAPRAYHEINGDLRDAMKRESLAKTRFERIDAIYDLVDVYLELKHDPRLDNAPTLQQYKTKLWSRLLRVKKDLQREIARAAKDAPPSEVLDDREFLRKAGEDAEATAAGLASQLALVSYSLGGPAQVFADSGSGFGGGPVRDYGADLVALIERTITPDFWDVNGGPGSIVYYAPLQVLVVRATSEIHHKIGGEVEGLRAAGR